MTRRECPTANSSGGSCCNFADPLASRILSRQYCEGSCCQRGVISSDERAAWAKAPQFVVDEDVNIMIYGSVPDQRRFDLALTALDLESPRLLAPPEVNANTWLEASEGG